MCSPEQEVQQSSPLCVFSSPIDQRQLDNVYPYERSQVFFYVSSVTMKTHTSSLPLTYIKASGEACNALDLQIQYFMVTLGVEWKDIELLQISPPTVTYKT